MMAIGDRGPHLVFSRSASSAAERWHCGQDLTRSCQGP